MNTLIDFMLIDGMALSFANVVSFMGFTVVVGSFVMICQAFARASSIRS